MDNRIFMATIPVKFATLSFCKESNSVSFTKRLVDLAKKVYAKQCNVILPSNQPILGSGQLDAWNILFPEEPALPEEPKKCTCSIQDLMIQGCTCKSIVRYQDRLKGG